MNSKKKKKVLAWFFVLFLSFLQNFILFGFCVNKVQFSNLMMVFYAIPHIKPISI
jgi:hypothetical protein